MSHDEDRLLNIEYQLISYIRGDPRLLDYAKELTADSFRNPRNGEAFRAVQTRSSKETTQTDAVVGGTPVRKWARELLAAAPNRPAWVEPPPLPPPPPRPPDEARPDRAKPEPKTRSRKRSKEFIAKRCSFRRGDLRVLVKYLKREPRVAMAGIVSLFPGRDVGDPEDVHGREIGAAMKLTEQKIFAIEDEATAFGRMEYGKPKYRFAFRTITCYDQTAEDVKKLRRSRSNKRTTAKRKTERMERAMQPNLHQQNVQPGRSATPSYASLKEATAANVRAQEQALLEAISQEVNTVADLMARVSTHASWLALAAGDRDTFRRIISRRLDKLKEDGAIDHHHRGVRHERVVFRI
jgi:hypothetical protein